MDKMNMGLDELRQRLEEAKAELNATPYDTSIGSHYRAVFRKVARLDDRIEALEAERG